MTRAIRGGCLRRWKVQSAPRRAALCLRPGGLETTKEVSDAVADAGKRLERAGWTVEEVTDIPPFEEAAEWQIKLWLADGYDAMVDAAKREGDPGALAVLRGHEKTARSLDFVTFSKALTRRATLVRDWQLVLREVSPSSSCRRAANCHSHGSWT